MFDSAFFSFFGSYLVILQTKLNYQLNKALVMNVLFHILLKTSYIVLCRGDKCIIVKLTGDEYFILN